MLSLVSLPIPNSALLADYTCGSI